MAETEIIVTREGRVATIRLNTPKRLNAVSGENLQELGRIWPQLGADPAVRAIVFTGTGRGFCSGAYLGGGAGARGEVSSGSTDDYPRFTARHLKVYKPVITAVNGVCAGAGLHFVTDADIVIASESASFTDTHVNVGRVTAMEPIGLTRRISAGWALRMAILGKSERLDAQAALRIGLVTEVVAHEKLLERAKELAEIAAQGSPQAVRKSIQAIWESFDLGLEAALLNGYRILRDATAHPDAAEGAKAFMEKREPRWQD